MKVARFLESSPAVRFVYYPGLEDANNLIADLQQAFEKAGIA